MKNGKQAKTERADTALPALEMYRFSHWYSPDGSFFEHNTTSEKGLLVQLRGSESYQSYLNTEMSRSHSSIAPLSLESARHLRGIIYRFMKDSLVDHEPIEVLCNGIKENGDNCGLEFRQYKKLSKAEKAMIEAALKNCRKRGEPEIRLIFQKNGKKKY